VTINFIVIVVILAALIPFTALAQANSGNGNRPKTDIESTNSEHEDSAIDVVEVSGSTCTPEVLLPDRQDTTIGQAKSELFDTVLNL
jgi:hypothetical protein